MNNDSKSEKHSTSRTKVNVERIKLMMCGNRPLTVRMVVREMNIGKKKFEKVITDDLDMSER